MKLIFALVLVCVAAGAATARKEKKAAFTCQTVNGPNLEGFNGKKTQMNFPCKYWALREQTCGDYVINLSAKNIWLSHLYQLDVMWLGVRGPGGTFIGRTTNKVAVKAHNSGNAKDLFNVKDGGNMSNSDMFTTGTAEGAGVWVQDKDETFKITFFPWDPKNREKYSKSQWKFECFDESMVPNEYPEQMCGGLDKKAMETRASELEPELKSRFLYNTIYIDVFNNSDIVHWDKKCERATRIFTKGGRCRRDVDWQTLVMYNCAELLYETKTTECITSYNCSPMQTFNACLRWGCKDEFQGRIDGDISKHCEQLSEDIYFCNKRVKGAGNLTDRAEEANCYRDFLRIEEQ